jgi:hypothetical protein
MITDTEVKMKGIKALTESLGSVGAERFIALIQREPFDYTKWQRTLWEGQSVEEISRNSMKISESVAKQDAGDDRRSRSGLNEKD